MLRRALTIGGLVLVLAGGCGDGNAESGPCAGVADRWARIQQEYLDRLGDADTAELDAGSARVEAAAAWFGPAVIEQVRDARAVGCAEEFVAGSALLCDRLDHLGPSGEAAERVVADLASNCGDE